LADYYTTITGVQARMELQEVEPDSVPNGGQLLALVDSLFCGTLNDTRRETVQSLRAGILALAE
jgi:hypothetical protein